ncbi:MAG: hypothetical protein EPO22_06175, partial [Dehalococcoidia bacterium]
MGFPLPPRRRDIRILFLRSCVVKHLARCAGALVALCHGWSLHRRTVAPTSAAAARRQLPPSAARRDNACVTTSPGLTIVGLGPAGAELLTVEARDTLAAAAEVWLRTARHPAVAGLPQGPAYHSFDDVYERGASFQEVYDEIAGRLLDLAARPAGVVYAVPGHPSF